MSADSQGDTGNLNKDEKSIATASRGISVTSTVDEHVIPVLNKDEKSRTATESKGISVTSTVDENVILSQTKTDQNTLLTPASKANIPKNDDKEDNDEEIEKIIEKKLPIDKDKGLDVDSELDFELKWDDDTDLNEDLLDTGNEIESALTSVDEGIDNVSKNTEVTTSIEKDLESEKDAESILTSIDEGLDSVTKVLETTTTSNMKDLVSEEKATATILTSIDEALDSISRDTETTLTSIDKVIDNANEEMQSTLTSNDNGHSSAGQDIESIASTKKELGNAGPETEVAMPSVEKDNDLDDFDCKMDDNVEINTAPDTNVMDIDEVAEETQSKPVDVLVLSDELKNTNMSNNKSDTLSVVTGRIELATKSSPNESEANSLDEQLVYSDDVEVPDIEDKDLLDEIDAQISETNKYIDELNIKDTEKIQALPEPSTSQEEYKQSEKSQRELDELDEITETKKIVDELAISNTEKIQVSPEPSTNQEECKQSEKSQRELGEIDEITETKKIVDELAIKDTEKIQVSPEPSANQEECKQSEKSQRELDEIDEITETKKILDVLAIKVTKKIQVSPEPSTNQEECKENETSQKDLSELDADSNLINSTHVIQKSDLSDTCASGTDMETSSYDINNEHGLDKPDVMIDIPTQELIESFDDSGETSDTVVISKDKLEESENATYKPDLIQSTTSEEDTKIMTESQATVDTTNLVQSDKNDDSRKDKVESVVDREKSADDTAKIESMDVDTCATSVEEIKTCEENSNGNTNIEAIKPIQENMSAIEKLIHTDVILESNQANLASTEERLSEGDIILEANSEQLKLDADKTSGTKETEVNKEIEEKSFANQDVNDVESKPKDIEVAPSTSKDHQELSDEDQEASKSKNIDVAQPSTSKDHQELSDKDQEASKSKDIDVAQPSTSKDHQELSKDTDEAPSTSKYQELSDEVQEASKSKDIDVVPSTSKDHQEQSDEDQEASKSKDIDEAPSTSKDHQELSDEDQETSDSLGLLAESSRIMDDEDEQENEAEDDDDDDDFDQDDESNQMMTEHSEDSNAQHSESDVPKESMEIDESNDAAEPIDDAEIQDMETATDEVYDVDSHGDESSADKGDFQIQIAGVVSGVPEVEAEAEESVETTAETPESIEVQETVEALVEDKPAEEEQSNNVPEPAASVEEAAKLPEDAEFTALQNSRLRALLLKDSSDSSNETSEAEQKSPSRSKNLEISKPKHEINIVELEESSSEDDVQVYKPDQPEPTPPPKEVTPAVEESLQKTDVSDVTKPTTEKPTTLDTERKRASPAKESPVIPETTAPLPRDPKAPIDLGEIFSLDSDDEDTDDKNKRKKKLTAVEIDKAGETNKCINKLCFSDVSVPLVPASISASVYYAANPQRGSGLCINCAQRFEERSKKLIEGVKDLTPYLEMDMCMVRDELVEISDSDSDDDAVVRKDDVLGEKGVKFLEEQLADMFNDTWKKYDMEARLMTAQAEISREVCQLEEECKKIDAMFHDCQTDTDKLRNDLYGTFADDRRILPSISIFDTPTNQWSGLEELLPPPVEKEPRQAKRRLPAPAEPEAKRPAIPLPYAPLDASKEPQDTKPAQPPAEVPLPPEDDNADISVVKLSVESAPAGLPPPGVATRPPLRPNMLVFAMRNSFGAWHKVRIVEVQPKVANQFTMCRVRFEHPKNTSKVLPARCLAYERAPDVRLTIGTRVVALFKDHRNLEVLEKKEAYYSGIVAEIPNPVNNFRYLIFFDDGYAQYVQHAVTRLVCECAPRVWDEVHPFSRQFVRDYLRAYPERPMVRLHAGQSIKTEWNGKWWPSKVLQVDASLVHVSFDGKKEAGIDKTEWIYRGSTRLAPLFLELQAAERQRTRPLPRAQAGRRFNMPYVEYTRPDDPPDSSKPAPPQSPVKTMTPAQNLAQTQAQIEQEIRRQRAVAKKSTAVAPPPQPVRENVTSRVVYYSPKNAIKPHKWVHHTCGPQCKRKDVLALKDLRTYNPLTKPLLSGWERHTLRFRAPQSKTAMYRAPCGRRIRNHAELHQYLQAIESDMSVDLFDFNPHTHCLAEFVLNKCIVSKKDLSHGKENVPVPCVNYYDDSLPEFCSYNTERTPTAGVPLNLDPEFLCGCDCTDDCADKTKCACWKMTLEGARTIGLDTDEVGYVYKRLPEPLPSGIYECNSRCKCRQTCLNRVAQHPLQLKLQVFKTANRGWGIRALNDVPKGAFLCVYAGNLLTDATANLDGLNEGDEYLAELDYIEVVEQMKEGFEEDIPDDAKKLDQDDTSSSSLSSDEEPARDEDDDFRPALPAGQYRENAYSKRLRKREKSKKSKENEEKEKKAKEDKDKNSEECITISDDEELREPARFAARSGMGGKEFVSKYKSVRAHFGKDEACYIMDAKVQGNIGRYLNHSCTPNVFVQNVFVDTHDPRFPWVAFFALSHIKAGTELTWNYNYDIGSVPGKVLYCYCMAPNCRGRLL